MGNTKQSRPKARLPRGFRDLSAAEVLARRAMLDVIRGVYERYGFDPLETPAFEYADALGKFLPDADRPMGGVFALQDDDEQWLALRYDLTAPLARFVAQNYDALPKPFRRYQTGPVWRNEKPGPGRFREFVQFDVDIVGSASMAADAELCAVLADALEALGIARGAYRIRVNDRKVLSGVLEAIGIGAEREGQRLAVLRAIDKLDRLGIEAVRELLGAGRRDESGDFTPGAGLAETQAEMVLRFVAAGAQDRATVCRTLRDLVGRAAIGLEGVEELERIGEALDAFGCGTERVVFDPSVVRGLGYYTGPVFEAELTFEITDESGRRVQFGSVAGGGRYDDLVERFLGRAVPASGVSIGVDRLLAALGLLRAGAAEARAGPVVVLVLDRARLAEYHRIAAELRRAGIRAELYLGESGMRAQLKYADRRQAPVAVIIGEDEFARDEVTLKDLALGAELAKGISTRADWLEERPAQITVPRARLVPSVQEMLARHGAVAVPA